MNKKTETLGFLSILEDIVNESSTMPFSSKVMVDKKELLDIIEDIRESFPEEIKEAKWVKEEREKILEDAELEANERIFNAEKQAEKTLGEVNAKIDELANEHVIVEEAEKKAEEILRRAREDARNLRLGSKEYASDVMKELEDSIKRTLDTVSENKNSIENI